MLGEPSCCHFLAVLTNCNPCLRLLFASSSTSANVNMFASDHLRASASVCVRVCVVSFRLCLASSYMRAIGIFHIPPSPPLCIHTFSSAKHSTTDCTHCAP